MVSELHSLSLVESRGLLPGLKDETRFHASFLNPDGTNLETKMRFPHENENGLREDSVPQKTTSCRKGSSADTVLDAQVWGTEFKSSDPSKTSIHL